MASKTRKQPTTTPATRKNGQAAVRFPIRPLEDRVIVKRDEAADRTPGGILLPDIVKDKKLCRGTVVRVGPGKHVPPPAGVDPLLMPASSMPVKEGERVIFGQYSGWDLPEHPEYVMMRVD